MHGAGACRRVAADDLRRRRLAPSPEHDDPDAPMPIISERADHEQVRRDGEDVAGLAQAAQVGERDERDGADADERRGRRASAGNADTICSTADEVDTADRQDVVDEQRRGRDERGQPAEVRLETEYEPPPFG